MGLESAVKAVEAYVKIISENIQMDISIDPVILNVLSSFALTFFLGHKVAEFSVRKAMGEYYSKLPETARSGMVGVYYFSALVLIPILTYLGTMLGVVAAAVLLIALPYHHGKNLRRSLEEKEAKKRSANVFPAGADMQPLSTTAPRPSTVKAKKTKEEELAELSMKVKIWKAKVRNTIKNILNNITAPKKAKDTHKEGQIAEQGEIPPVRRTTHGSSVKEHEQPKPAIKLEDVLSDTETTLSKGTRVSKRNAQKTKRTTKLEEVLPEYTVVEQKRKKEPEKKERKSREEIEDRGTAEEEKQAGGAKEACAEVPEEIKVFRKVLDEMETKYIKKTSKTLEGEKRPKNGAVAGKKDKTQEIVETKGASKKKVAVEDGPVSGPEKTAKDDKKTTTQAKQHGEERKAPATTTAETAKTKKGGKGTTGPNYSKTTYSRIKTALKNILIEREKAKLERVTWRDVRKIRKKVEDELEKYHQKIVEEALKLGDRASKTDIDRAARRILGIEQTGTTAKKPAERRAKHKDKKERAEKEQEKKAGAEDEGIISLLDEGAESGGDDDILALLGDEGEVGEDDDLSKLLKD